MTNILFWEFVNGTSTQLPQKIRPRYSKFPLEISSTCSQNSGNVPSRTQSVFSSSPSSTFLACLAWRFVCFKFVLHLFLLGCILRFFDLRRSFLSSSRRSLSLAYRTTIHTHTHTSCERFFMGIRFSFLFLVLPHFLYILCFFYASLSSSQNDYVLKIHSLDNQSESSRSYSILPKVLQFGFVLALYCFCCDSTAVSIAHTHDLR